MYDPPQYRWTLAFYDSTAYSAHGIEPSVLRAKGELTKAIRRAGGLAKTSTAIVHKPSGGGWIARRTLSGLAWREFGHGW